MFISINLHLICLIIILYPLSYVKSGDILFLFHFSSHSQRLFLKPFTENLMSRGHTVTYIGDLKTPSLANITEISVETETSKNVLRFLNDFILVTSPNSPCETYRAAEKFMQNEEDVGILRDERIKTLIRNGKKFDVVFTGGILEGYALPIANLFSENIIFIQFMRMFPPFTSELDVILPYSYVPFTLSEFKSDMNFFERTLNSLLSFYFGYFLRDLSRMDAKITKQFPQAPKIFQVHSRISLLFVTSDPVLYYSAPVMPHVISVGGMNCREAKPLTEDLEEIMSSSENGVIYFSLGTVVDLKMTPKGLIDVFLDAFSRLNQTILWKASFQLKGVSANVKFVKWVPQQDVLGHPKLRLYITQGGVFGLHEAIYHGVPVIGLPVLADQFSNVVRMEELGLGLHLDLFSLTSDKIYDSIIRIINDPSYYESCKKYSMIFKNQPETPMERAIFWTEHLMKHPGSSLHFRTSASQLNLFQYHSLDILLSIAALLVLSSWISIKLIMFCIGKKNKKTVIQKVKRQ